MVEPLKEKEEKNAIASGELPQHKHGTTLLAEPPPELDLRKLATGSLV